MPLDAFRLIHVIGVILLFLSLGGATLQVAGGGTRESPGRRLGTATHGIALLVIVVAGFGMLARLGIMGSLPGWVWVKLLIWLLLGGAIMLPFRRPGWSRALWVVIPVLGALAAWLGIFKPF